MKSKSMEIIQRKCIQGYQALLQTFLLCLVLIPSLVSATILSYQRSGNMVNFALDKGSMCINVCKEDVVEVRYSVMEKMPAGNSLVVINKWKEPVAFNVSKKMTSWSLKLRG